MEIFGFGLDGHGRGTNNGGMRDLRKRIPNIQALADALGSDYSHIFYCLAGMRPDGRMIQPSVDLAKRIQVASNGAIKWTEFFEDERKA